MRGRQVTAEELQTIRRLQARVGNAENHRFVRDIHTQARDAMKDADEATIRDIRNAAAELDEWRRRSRPLWS